MSLENVGNEGGGGGGGIEEIPCFVRGVDGCREGGVDETSYLGGGSGGGGGGLEEANAVGTSEIFDVISLPAKGGGGEGSGKELLVSPTIDATTDCHDGGGGGEGGGGGDPFPTKDGVTNGDGGH